MTTTNRDAARDEVSIPQPKPSASKLSVPVLHGLTLNQLEATRGYTDACARATAAHDAALTIMPDHGGERPPMTSIARVKRLFEQATPRIAEVDSSSYGDGVRYALSTARVVDQLQEVETMLLGWKR